MGVNFNYNRAEFCGRFTADVELKTTPNGISVCTFTIAVNRRFTKDGERKADFINCVAWRKTAEIIANHFHKGSPIFVAGEIQTRDYTDNNNIKRYITELVVNEAYFVESKSGAGTDTGEYAPAGFIAVDADDDDCPF